MRLIEVQVDRLVGPTHHFGGLGVGNLASFEHAGQESNPQAAALQGLDKMKLVASFGVPQVILPPQPRPDFAFLRGVGFSGSDVDVLKLASAEQPELMSAAASSSAMWVANAAAVSAGIDNGRGVPTLSVANLNASIHRSIEPEQTFFDLQNALSDGNALASGITVFPKLLGGAAMRDEGAANHMRLGSDQNLPGIHVFVYGDGDPTPSRHWPRQSRLACEAIARQHDLPPENTFFLKQHPEAIDAGAFHNDVVAASHLDVFIHHALAFYAAETPMRRIEDRYHRLFGQPLKRIVVANESLSLGDAVSTYLFNSQIVSPDNENMRPVIICPAQVQQNPNAKRLTEDWCGSNGIFRDVRFVDLTQSMSGGGGPACLRLRIPMTPVEIDRIPTSVLWSDTLDERLRQIIRDTYPTLMRPSELTRPDVLEAVKQAESTVAAMLQTSQ